MEVKRDLFDSWSILLDDLDSLRSLLGPLLALLFVFFDFFFFLSFSSTEELEDEEEDEDESLVESESLDSEAPSNCAAADDNVEIVGAGMTTGGGLG